MREHPKGDSMFKTLGFRSWFSGPFEYQLIERGELAGDFARIAGDMNRVCEPLNKNTQIAYQQAQAEGKIKDGQAAHNQSKRKDKLGV